MLVECGLHGARQEVEVGSDAYEERLKAIRRRERRDKEADDE